MRQTVILSGVVSFIAVNFFPVLIEGRGNVLDASIGRRFGLSEKFGCKTKTRDELTSRIQAGLDSALQSSPSEKSVASVNKSRLQSAAGKTCVSSEDWADFEGDELHSVEVVSALAKSGLDMANDFGRGWKPVNKDVEGALKRLTSLTPSKKFVEELGEDILVWYSNLDDNCYGHELPVIKSRAIIPLSPENFANILMDSSKVRLYNKISQGRTDTRVFQRGIDTVGNFGNGETKIVRNITKPPLTKKLMEFVTLMHARRLSKEDGEDDGYLVVSRAINSKLQRDASQSKGDSANIRSEILLGVNVIRSIPGEPNKSDLVCVTHVNSPIVPKLLAKKLGVKGAFDFIDDIRALSK